MDYPVTVSIACQPHPGRGPALRRLVWVAPIGLWLALYSLLAGVIALLAWPVIVLTGSYPRPLYKLTANYVRVVTAATAYLSLLVDERPSLTAVAAQHPVQVTLKRLERYDRSRALSRPLLAIPVMLLRWAVGLLAKVCVLLALGAGLVGGELPDGLRDVLSYTLIYCARADAYLLLATESRPPLADDAAFGTNPATS